MGQTQVFQQYLRNASGEDLRDRLRYFASQRKALLLGTRTDNELKELEGKLRAELQRREDQP